MTRRFWSSVNLTGNQTYLGVGNDAVKFWSSVNLTGNQTEADDGFSLASFGAVSI